MVGRYIRILRGRIAGEERFVIEPVARVLLVLREADAFCEFPSHELRGGGAKRMPRTFVDYERYPGIDLEVDIHAVYLPVQPVDRRVVRVGIDVIITVDEVDVFPGSGLYQPIPVVEWAVVDVVVEDGEVQLRVGGFVGEKFLVSIVGGSVVPTDDFHIIPPGDGVEEFINELGLVVERT